MATVTISHLLERFEHAARGYLDDVAGEPKEKLATKPVRDDVPLSRAIATLEAVAMPSKAATSAKTKNTRIVLELIQSLQHWRDLQLASVRALEKSMDPESSYAGSAKKAKPASDAHSANPLCERLLFAVEEVFLSGTVAVLSGGNESPSARPSSPPGPAGRPEPVLTLETRAAATKPTMARYDSPSSRPSRPKGPAGKPPPVVATE